MNTRAIVARNTGEPENQSSEIGQRIGNSQQEPGKGLSIMQSARPDLETTLQLLAERAQYITGASGAAIALRDGDRVLCRASSGSAAPELGCYLDLSAGLSGQSVRMRAALRCDDTAIDPRVDRESCRRLGIASFAVMPILHDGEVVGIFEIFAGKPRAFQERDLAALERLREMVNTALDRPAPDRANATSFQVHETKVRVKVAGACSSTASGPAANPVRADGKESTFAAGVTRSQRAPEEEKRPVERIEACKNCGLPVSEGRSACLDCETKGIPAGYSGFLFAVDYNPPRSEIKSWIIANRYVIGMVLISVATIAFALLR
jgi:RNA polymerase subunit RPABC4/transcription elongation factor Spt4